MANNPNYIIGKNCVQEVLDYSKERILQVTTSHELDDPLIKKLLGSKINVKKVGTKTLDSMVNSTSHQGYVASVRKKDPIYLENVIEKSKLKKRSLIVILDSIFDPQNVGAILRSCECFGVDAVIISKNKGCSITPVVSKTSVGATEIVPICEVSNLTTTVEKLQKEGYWAVSAELNEKSVCLNSFTFPEKTVLILGSEGKGVQKILSNKADFHVFIKMLGRIDSLNVSNAASVFLYKFNLNTY
jgi:23S rRNA (guanosine2251-2'-O)-methyltransferase